MADFVVKSFQETRKELLDLDLRNVRLNFKLTQRQINVVETTARAVYERLVFDGNTCIFRSRSGSSARPAGGFLDNSEDEFTGTQPDGEESASSARTAERPASLRPGELQTLLKENELQARLLRMHSDAKLFIEERGINALFLALGFVHWVSAEDSSEARRAPLLLVPVELQRDDAGSDFRIVYTGDEIDLNPALTEKFLQEFAIHMPFVENAEHLPIERYFERLAEAIGQRSGWSLVFDEIHLGFFATGRFQMFKDLDPHLWPAEKQPSNHPVLSAILGMGLQDSEFRSADRRSFDEYLEPGSLPLILDADSSQLEAILGVVEGKNLVIQGPPGTGKSQTIANIIALSVAQGKKVLFVSEKKAALEVVKRRLEQTGIGMLALELHSQKTTRKVFLQELQRSIENQDEPDDGDLEEVGEMVRHRKVINQYLQLIHRPVGRSKISFYQAAGKLLLLSPEDPHRPPLFDITPMAEWDDTRFKLARSRLEEIAEYLDQSGGNWANLFFDSGLTQFVPTEEAELRQMLAESGEATRRLIKLTREFSRKMQMQVEESHEGVQEICRVSRILEAAPELRGVKVDSPFWLQQKAALNVLLESGKAYATTRFKYREWFTRAAWSTDLIEVKNILIGHGEKASRLISGSYRRACAKLASLLQTELPATLAERVELIDVVQYAREHERIVKKNANLGAVLFGPHWNGVQSDWKHLSDLVTFLQNIHIQVGQGKLPEAVLQALGLNIKRGSLQQALDMLDEQFLAQQRTVARLADRLKLRFSGQDRISWGRSLQQQYDLLQKWETNLQQLRSITSFNSRIVNLQNSEMSFIAEKILEWDAAPQKLLHEFEYAWYFGRVARAYQEFPVLNQLDGIALSQHLARFRRLDSQLKRFHRSRLQRSYLKTRVGIESHPQLALVKREIHKKRLHMPTRRLLAEAAGAIQTLKPVFMMSPMSVASFLPQGELNFDLVVFDEASQVRPADAFGAILRGKQLVVVGDEKQLPPTRFFEQQFSEEEEPDYESTRANESILDLMLSRNALSRMLRWHYRSCHQSLIAVSNREFYNDEILIFPTAGYEADASGLTFHCYSETVYERGKSATNPMEARYVARAVMEHARTRPHLSLGVVAFSVNQRDRIQEEVEVLRRQYPQYESYFEEAVDEPFFVKNLETVQGDERDVILISIGYGFDAEGTLSMNFGPLNSAGGERRLNVLISRGRMAVRIFANFMPEDLDLERARSTGIRVLKTYLQFAHTGIMETAEHSNGKVSGPFEEAVIAALRANSIEVESHIGSSGFYVDIAVVDPEYEGCYLMGIECDGVGYRSSRSARDRERIRQEILTRLGWRMHRIWTTDWFNHPVQELEKLLLAIKQARQERPAMAHTAAEEVYKEEPQWNTLSDEEVPIALAAPNTPEINLHGAVDLRGLPIDGLVQSIRTIVEIESPIHQQTLVKRVALAVNDGIVEDYLVERINEAVDNGCRAGAFKLQDGFLWPVI